MSSAVVSGATQTSTTRRVLEYWERIQETYTDPATGILCDPRPSRLDARPQP